MASSYTPYGIDEKGSVADFDIFIGGPPQRKTKEAYVDIARTYFKDKALNLFSPFDRPTQQNGTWFEDNLEGIRSSKAMLAYVPSFPFPGVVWEAGVFYESHVAGNTNRLDNLVCVIADPLSLEGPSGKSVLAKQGHLFTDLHEALRHLDAYFSNIRSGTTEPDCFNRRA